MTNPFLSLAVLDTNDAKHRPYCAQIRSQSSSGASAPTPFPSPVAGEGPSGQIAACSTHRLGSVTFCDWCAETKLKINLISIVYPQIREAVSLPVGAYRCVGGLGVPPE